MKLKLSFILLISFIFAASAFSQGGDYWQQEIAYEMDIDVDAPNHQFTGSQKATYTNNSPDTLNRVYYHLYFNAFQPGSMMDVRSRTIEDPDGRVADRIFNLPEDEIGYHRINNLMQDGEAVDYEVDGTILVVTLNEAIEPGESSTFEMEFNSQVPRQIRRSGWANAEGVEFSMSQWYPKMSEYDDDGWHPNPYIGREFYGIWGTFDVEITIDASYVMGATGHLQNADEIGYNYGDEVDHSDTEKLTWHWKAENVHDFFWGADPDFVHTKKQVPNGPMLHFLYQQDIVATNAADSMQTALTQSWERLPDFTSRAFQYMSENFGKYPYDNFTVIQGGDGGMEYPMGTLITGNRSFGSLVGVTVHEFIHNWYYGVLGTNESRYPWMDEGFTTYTSALTMNHIFEAGRTNLHQGSYRSYLGMQQAGRFEALDTHADHYNTNGAYGTASYSTGAVFLAQLRYIIGGEAFDSGMKRYFNTWKFKHPDGRDFLRVMEKESDMVLDWYYEYFVESTKTIDYGINSVQADSSDNSQTTITLERVNLMPMPVEVVVEYTDGSNELFYMPLRIMRGEKPAGDSDISRRVMPDWPWVNPTYSLSIDRVSSEIARIEIDPSLGMADIDRSNNVYETSEQMDDSNGDQ